MREGPMPPGPDHPGGSTEDGVAPPFWDATSLAGALYEAAKQAPGDPTLYASELVGLLRRAADGARADEEFVHALGRAGGHTALLTLLELPIEDVQEAASDAVEACTGNLPAGVGFPMRGRPVGARAAPDVLQVHVQTSEPQLVRLRRARERPDDRKIGNMLFTSSVLLARWVLRHAAKFEGRSVLELGAGLGLAGIAAAQHAERVTLTDLPAFVPNLRYNLSLNPAFVGDSAASRARAEALDWTLDSQSEPRSCGPCKEREAEGFVGQAQVVIGADIVHERWMAEAVCTMLQRYLGSGGVAYVLNPEAKSRAGVEDFVRLLPACGFRFTVERVSDAELLMGHEQECIDVGQELYTIEHIK